MILRKRNLQITRTLFDSDNCSNHTTNVLILNAAIDSLIANKRFGAPLFQIDCFFIVHIRFMFLYISAFFYSLVYEIDI